MRGGLGRLRRLTRELGGEVHGGDPLLRSVRSLEEAGPNDLAPLTHPRYRAHVQTTRAGAVLATPELADAARRAGRTVWIHREPWEVLATLLERMPQPRVGRKRVHRTAQVAKGAVLEAGVVVGRGVSIGPNAVVCRNAVIGEGCVLGPTVVIGPQTVLGRRVRVGASAVVGSDGFGHVRTSSGVRRIPHVGRVVVEDDVEIGANACIARATLGTTRIARGTRIDNLVQVGHNVEIGEDSLLAAQVGLAGSVRIGSGVLVGGQAGVADHLVVGDGARLAAKAGVIGDVPPGVTVAGYPARPRARWLREHAKLARLAAARARGKENPR